MQISEADQRMIKKRSIHQLRTLVIAQCLLLLVASLFCGIFFGLNAGLSALAGGITCLIPTCLFVAHLLLKMQLKNQLNVFGIFFSEAGKIMLTLIMMALMIKYARDVLVFPAFVFGIIVVLKAYLLALLKA
ncbi:ATP synthase subunit I [Basilea psittacipulmonis]|uniref:ATP synthase I n=1 Tax=Basilea psittacipulmonis DSM 24701 TaxID=1072685 RepID=A0A077DHE2_9BURK|nr:ATP synthase subunit I [Basilea psittacipulmonis]AIL32563.1 hypothetical protein IX83_03885 [Basilea psittacipulmonis DSM 24701]